MSVAKFRSLEGDFLCGSVLSLRGTVSKSPLTPLFVVSLVCLEFAINSLGTTSG